MATRKVLIVGMFDSVHLGRWLTQFSESDIEFTLFPSKKFRYADKQIIKLVKNHGKAVFKFATVYSKVSVKYLGYLDYVFNIMTFSLMRINVRKLLLKKILKNRDFDYIHLIEIQGAGYLYLESIQNIVNSSRVILTNYGSDINYFSQFETHKKKIRDILEISDFYSAECIRDYVLAKKLKFTGIDLPCIPNAGGNNSFAELASRNRCSGRKLIIVKAYGGLFGRADLLFEVFERLLSEGISENVFFYSVTDDYLNQAKALSQRFKGRFTYCTVKNPIPREKLLEIFSQSRIYVGASRSDGISTSFLEAITTGAFPVQTSTSCVDEWINKGCIATLVSENCSEIYEAVKFALENDNFVDRGQQQNQEIAKKYLNSETIKNEALKFYGVGI